MFSHDAAHIVIYFVLQDDCMACGNVPQTLSFSEDDKLQDIINFLIESVS